MHKVSIIIAVYNVLEYTQQCLQTIKAFVPAELYEIIVIDNGSTDGTAEWLQQQDNIQMIRNEENRGTAAAYNQGLRCAHGDTILFLHNDVVLTKGALEGLLCALYENDTTGAVGPVTNRSWVNQQIPGADYRDFSGLADFALQVRRKGELKQIQLYLEGFCLLVKRSAIEAVGDFDEAFSVHMMEDIDYSLRLLQAGYSLRLAPDIYVHHEKGTFNKLLMDTNKILFQERNVFWKKWQFDIGYSGTIRGELLTHMDLQKENVQVLDVGCACGGNLMYIRDQNPDARLYGIELNKHAASVAQCFGQVSSLDVETLDQPEWIGRFDYIIMGDILEHLRNPWQTVQNMRHLLNSDGKLIASIPNVMYLGNVYALLSGHWQYENAGILDRTHLRFFTRQEILKMMQDAAMDISSLSYVDVCCSAELQRFKEELLSLKTVQVDAEDVTAYQWIVVAQKHR